MKNLPCAILILTLVPVSCDCFKFTLQYKQLQGDAALGGMYCAMSRRETARGVEFDTADDTCTSLGTDWFSSPTTQPGNNYLELIEFAHYLKQITTMTTLVPENFRLGDSIVLHLKKEANAGGVVKFFLDIFDGDAVLGRWGPTDHIYFHIDNAKYTGILNFNAFVNGVWLLEQQIIDPFYNDTGKLELVVMASEIWVYVDDNNVYNYTTPLTVPYNLVVHYRGVDTELERLHVLYKN